MLRCGVDELFSSIVLFLDSDPSDVKFFSYLV